MAEGHGSKQGKELERHSFRGNDPWEDLKARESMRIRELKAVKCGWSPGSRGKKLGEEGVLGSTGSGESGQV